MFQGGGDDAAAACLSMTSGCGFHPMPCPYDYGAWTGVQSCAAGEKICGLQTRVEPPVSAILKK